MDDYYLLLGVNRDASFDEIKRAFRRLIKQNHPDKSKDSEKAIRIIKAYETLKAHREMYDNTLETEQEIKKGSNFSVILKVHINEVVNGTLKKIKIKRKGMCQLCKGTGSKNKKLRKCIYCGGSGYQGMSVILKNKKKCIYCGGKGSIPDGESCQECSNGIIDEEVKTQIKLNPLQHIYTIQGLGNYIYGNEKPGDLDIHLDIIQYPGYAINGLNVESRIFISPAQAILGDVISLNICNKKIRVKIPSGIDDGYILYDKDSGISYKGMNGNLKIKVSIVCPKIITEKEKKLYEEILSIEKDAFSCPKILM